MCLGLRVAVHVAEGWRSVLLHLMPQARSPFGSNGMLSASDRPGSLAPCALLLATPVAEAEGDEVSEPLMHRRCYAGHLSLSGLAGGNAVPLAPPLAFLGAHSGAWLVGFPCCTCNGSDQIRQCLDALLSMCPVIARCGAPHCSSGTSHPTRPCAELLVSPSDDGNLFVWDYASGSLAAVLAPPTAAQPTLSAAGSPGAAEAAELPAAAAATCVAAHPLLPVLASGGSDSVVRLWSPEAEEAACIQFAAAAAQANLQRLAAAGMQPPDGSGLLPAAWRGPPPDCRAM